MGEVVSGKVGEREATLFRDFLSIIGTGTTATSSAAPVEVTATIDNKVVSWINNWFGKLNTASSTAPAEVTATIDGNVVSWVNHWLGRATSTSDSAPAPVTTEKSNIGISTINACTLSQHSFHLRTMLITQVLLPPKPLQSSLPPPQLQSPTPSLVPTSGSAPTTLRLKL